MTWIDVLVGLGFLVFIWAGVFKGFIKEFFELLIVTVNPLLCTHVFGYLSDLLNRWFGAPHPWAGTLSFIAFSAIGAMILWILAGKVEMLLNISPSHELNKIGGGIFAAMKGIVILWIIVLSLGQIPMSETGITLFKNSPTISLLDNLSGPMDTLYATAGSARFYPWIHHKINGSNF